MEEGGGNDCSRKGAIEEGTEGRGSETGGMRDRRRDMEGGMDGETEGEGWIERGSRRKEGRREVGRAG